MLHCPRYAIMIYWCYRVYIFTCHDVSTPLSSQYVYLMSVLASTENVPASLYCETSVNKCLIKNNKIMHQENGRVKYHGDIDTGYYFLSRYTRTLFLYHLSQILENRCSVELGTRHLLPCIDNVNRLAGPSTHITIQF